jgi:osmotically-inducible protein OsmY
LQSWCLAVRGSIRARRRRGPRSPAEIFHRAALVPHHITVAPRAVERDVRHRIVEALHRNANLDARHITVTISGDRAILSGSVGTWLQRESAERAAADAPGIAHVENRIVVEPRSFDAVPDEIC